MAKNFCFCAVDGGAVAALNPVAKLVHEKSDSVIWVTEEKAIKALNKKGIGAQRLLPDTYHAFLTKNKIDAVVCGVTGNCADITLHLAKAAMEQGVPVVKVLDFYGTGHPHEGGFAPTKLCVIDEPSRDQEARLRNMPVSDVIATGSPAFDSLDSYAGTGASIPQPFVLMVLPSNKERVDEFLDVVLPVLKQSVHQVPLGVLVHPKSLVANGGDVEPEEVYRQIRTLPQVRLLTDEYLRKLALNDVLIAKAELVIGTTSTELVKACYFKIPNISILPRGGPNHAVLATRGIDRLPTVTENGTFEAETSNGLLDVLDGSPFFPNPTLWAAKVAYISVSLSDLYPLDGKSAQRVADVVYSVLK